MAESVPWSRVTFRPAEWATPAGSERAPGRRVARRSEVPAASWAIEPGTPSRGARAGPAGDRRRRGAGSRSRGGAGARRLCRIARSRAGSRGRAVARAEGGRMAWRLATRSQLSAEVEVVPGADVRDGPGSGEAPARAGPLRVVRQPAARRRGLLLLGRGAGRGGPGGAPGCPTPGRRGGSERTRRGAGRGGRWRAAWAALFVSAGGSAGRTSPTPEVVQASTSPPGGRPDRGGAPRRVPLGRAAHPDRQQPDPRAGRPPGGAAALVPDARTRAPRKGSSTTPIGSATGAGGGARPGP
jgi:hypothetical protein